MVKLQQGLQQAYCANGIKSADAVLTEANGMAYTSGATYLQLHRAAICFSDSSKIVKDRVAWTPTQQIMVQMHSAMCNTGLTFKDLQRTKDPEKIFNFVNATLAASIEDGKQTPYKSDYVLHSITPVKKEVAMANLQPVPGLVEYAPGCNACFYRLHQLGTGKEIYCR